MLRVFSYSLIISGLIVAGAGLESIWTSWHGEQQAEEQWEQQIADRSADHPAQPQAIDSRRVQRGEALARLSIGRLNRHWVVLEGADRGELKRGPGHLIDTALPGSRGNCVIAGHRDTQFRALRNVEIGEEISVERGGRTFLYRVTGTQIVSPNDTSSLEPTPTSTLTLVTCYPFYYVGPAPKRFVIRATLVS
jgi:sortase A